jgi:tetratricopeptide (TPR) repeat protein
MFGALDRAHAAIAPRIAANDLDGTGRVLATAILLTKGSSAEGIDLARRYLAAGDNSEPERAVLMNNLAWALIDAPEGEPTPARLAEADQLSAAAMSFLPRMLAVRGTRGAVLVERGEYRAAAELLDDRRFRLDSRRHRSAVKASLALALAGLGELEPADRALREALALDPDNDRAQRVRARLHDSRGQSARATIVTS